MPAPRAPARAVRPTRWMYVCGDSGQSYWMTQCTMGKSKPLAAMSVQKSTAVLQREKVRKISSLRNCFILPVRHMDGIRVFFRILEKARYMYLTWLHVLTNTMVLSCGWRFTNKSSASSFWCCSTTTKFWLTRDGVGAAEVGKTETLTGSRMQSCARAWTSVDRVAEKRRVWCEGVRCSMMPVSVSRKPMSNSLSASSSTKHKRLSRSKPEFSERCCNTLPGVPTMMLI